MTSLGILVVAFVFLAIIYLYSVGNFSYWKKRNVPYVNPVPFFGNLLNCFLLKCNIGEQLSLIYSNTKGPICGVFMLNRPAILLRDPKLIKQFLVTNAEIFNNRYVAESVNEEQNSKGSYGLLVAKNETWKNLRKTVTPAFSSLNMRAMSTNIEHSNELLINYLKNHTASNTEVEIRDISLRYSIQAVCSVFFDIEAECFSGEKSPWRRLGSAFFDYRNLRRGINVALSFISPKISKTLGMPFYDKATFDFVVGNVSESLKKRSDHYSKHDYLEILRNASTKLEGGKHILSSSIEVFGAGVEAISSSLTFAFYELAKNQNVQHELRQEILAVQGERAKISSEKLNQMTYLDLFVKELYRMHPQNPFLERVAREDFFVDNLQFMIEKGVTIYIPLLGIHHDPEYYPQPHIFRPERFLGDVNSASYLPFGIGPRMCIGKKYSELAVKFCVVNLVKNYEVRCSPRTPQNITYNSKGFTLQCSGDLFVELHPLKSD